MITPFQMQRAGLQPDVVSYALLINAYGKARREEEALAVFEEMLDAGVRYAGTEIIAIVIGGTHGVKQGNCTWRKLDWSEGILQTQKHTDVKPKKYFLATKPSIGDEKHMMYKKF